MKKGQIDNFEGVILAVGMLILVLLIYSFQDITVNVLEFELENGKIIDSKLQEKTLSRINSWRDLRNKGFYDVKITDENNLLIKQLAETGAGHQVYYIKKYIEWAPSQKTFPIKNNQSHKNQK